MMVQGRATIERLDIADKGRHIKAILTVFKSGIIARYMTDLKRIRVERLTREAHSS